MSIHTQSQFIMSSNQVPDMIIDILISHLPADLRKQLMDLPIPEEARRYLIRSAAPQSLVDTIMKLFNQTSDPQERNTQFANLSAQWKDIINRSVTQALANNSSSSSTESSQSDFAVNVIDNGTTYVVEAEVPGVRKEDMKVTIGTDKNLTISFTRHPSNNSGVTAILRGIKYGSMSRDIKMPANTDSKGITSTLENGVVRFTFQKKDAEEFNINL